MRFLLVFVLGLLAVSPVQAQDLAAGEGAGKALTASIIRPEPEGTPTEVDVGVFVIDISKINDVEQTFTADFALILRWQDPRLAGAQGVRSLFMKDIWHPYVLIQNQRKLSKHYREIVEVDGKGQVTYRQRFSGELTLPLDLKDFPFDQHLLPIQVASFRYGPQEVAFRIDTQRMGESEDFSISDWAVQKGAARLDPYYFAPQARNIARLVYEQKVSRYLGYYFWRIIFPMMIIVFMSWVVFWISPKQMGTQIGVASRTILTLFAFKFALTSLLPKIPYLTRLDIFILASTIMSFLAFVEVIITSKLAEDEENERKVALAKKTDVWCRWMFPAAFGLITIIVFVMR